MRSNLAALALAGTLLSIASLLPGCTKNSTAPAGQGRVYRTVTATLTDSLGTPFVDQQVVMIALVESAGVVPTFYQRTDGSGHAAFVLGNGPWAAAAEPIVVAGPPPSRCVAGATFNVPLARRPGNDTLVVVLRRSTASRVTGTTTLAGQPGQDGTRISTGACLFPVATTDSAGRWTLEDMPPGTWSIVMSHGGYASAVRTVTVPAPGSSVALPAVQLAGGAAPH